MRVKLINLVTRHGFHLGNQRLEAAFPGGHVVAAGDGGVDVDKTFAGKDARHLAELEEVALGRVFVAEFALEHAREVEFGEKVLHGGDGGKNALAAMEEFL
jgi:hypothetical protein